jgi:TrmH family RNA methyltransferase
MLTRVTSPANTRVKTSRQLHSRSGVLKNGLYLVEGPRFVSDRSATLSPEWVLLADDAGDPASELAGRLASAGCDVLQLPRDIFADVSDTETSQGIIAVMPLPASDPSLLPGTGLHLLLDAVSDPGNMGTILRSAAAFGCSAVVSGSGSCFPFIPKVTRAAAGLNGMVPLIYDVKLSSFIRDNRGRMEFAGADASGGSLERLHEKRGALGLVIGSEAHGISAEVGKLLDFTVAIPMAEGVESLNAAVSASILLREASRITVPIGSGNNGPASG